jgi:hypothetical protein
VEVHRGSIGFSSVPERGTRFEVRLPLASIGGDGGLPVKPPAGKSLPAPSLANRDDS